LHLLESDFGLSTCHQGPREQHFQWDYPNGWAPLHWITIKGLINYGQTASAKRITEKFLLAIANLYEKNNDLWEKYNIVDETLNVVNEYEMPSTLGWTAGTFIALMELMETSDLFSHQKSLES
jgi:alpha,alpha-trehalase